MKLVTLRTFQYAIDAHLLKSKLESEGIPCFLIDENMATMLPHHSMLSGGIKLKVPESHMEEALHSLHVIEEGRYTNENGEVLKCPKCGSEDFYTNINAASGSRKWFNISWALIFSSAPVFHKNVYECRKCRTQFENN